MDKYQKNNNIRSMKILGKIEKVNLRPSFPQNHQFGIRFFR